MGTSIYLPGMWASCFIKPWNLLVVLLQVGKTLRVGGWVKTGREAGAGAFAFLQINDGSCFDSIQVHSYVAKGGLSSS